MRTDQSDLGTMPGLRRRVALLAALLAFAAGCASAREDSFVAFDAPAASVQGGAADAEGGASRPGEEGAAGPGPTLITVEQAVDEAISNNRRVMQSRVGAAIGLADERIARSALLPTVGGRYTYSWVEDPQRFVITGVPGGGSFSTAPDQVNAFTISAGFPIFAFGRHLNRFRAAQLARRRTEADRDTTESDIAAAVTAAAFDVLEAIASIDVARSNEEALAQQVKDSQALFDAGSVTKVALLEASVEYDTAVREREKLESLIPILKMRLNLLLGRPADDPIEVEDDRALRAPIWKLPALKDEAVARRPELRAARLDAASAERSVRAQIGAELGEVRGLVAWDTTDNPRLTPQETLSFLLTFDLPFYTGGARPARIRRARHELELAELQLSDLEDEIRTEVADAHRAVVEAYRDIPVARSAVERAEESLRIQREKFKNGRATNREVLDTNALLTSSRIALVRAVYAYKVALRELHRARGADPRLSPLYEIGNDTEGETAEEAPVAPAEEASDQG